MKVMIATDGSPCSEHAIREAIRLLPLAQAQVVTVTITPEPLLGMEPLIGYGVPAGPTEAMLEQARALGQRHLEAARALLADAGVTPLEVVRDGDPAAALLDVAREVQPDLLVLGAHGRRAVERFLLGSVSDAVLHRWPGSVLIVRLPHHQG